jgi:hypothetical protein
MTTLQELYSFYLENCIDEDKKEIPLSYKEWVINYGKQEYRNKNKIMEKKYKLTKQRFADWLFSDSDDVEYWGRRFVNELRDEGEYSITLQEIFDERDEVPVHILENYSDLNEKQVDDWVDEVCITEVELID